MADTASTSNKSGVTFALPPVTPRAPDETRRPCCRCRTSLPKEWQYCGTCGQRQKQLPQTSVKLVVEAGAAKEKSRPTPQRSNEEKEELSGLPPKLVQTLNSVLRGFERGRFNESPAELEHKTMLVTALELEAALQIEDAYLKLETEGKIAKLAGANIQRESSKKTSSVVYGRNIKTSLLPSLSLGKKKKTTAHKSKPSSAAATAKGGYLDEVGSVATYYAELIEREKALAGLTRAVVADEPQMEEESSRHLRQRELIRLQQELLGEEAEEIDKVSKGKGGFLIDGEPVQEEGEGEGEEEREEEEEREVQGRRGGGEIAPTQVMFWGTLREKGRFFLPRDGMDAGQQFDPARFRTRDRIETAAGDDAEQSEETGDDGHLNWQQVLLEAEQLQAMETPMMWTELVHPFTPPLSRPLTPEPTSDDEDEEFERQLQKMEADKAEAKLKLLAETKSLGDADGGALDQQFDSVLGATTDGPIEVAPEDEDETTEMDDNRVDPVGAAAAAAQTRATKKARIAKARRAMAFEMVFKQARELAIPVPKRYKPKPKKPSEMNEDELRDYEVMRALRAGDEVGGGDEDKDDDDDNDDDDDDESTLTPEPVKVKSALPTFKAHSIISRLYKNSCTILKQAIKQSQFRLVDEYLPPPRSGRPLPFRRFSQMLAVVQEALLQAYGIDLQAKMEFRAFQEYVARARAEPATQVAAALQTISSFHSQYDERYKSLVANGSQLHQLNSLRAKAESELYTRGRELQELQADEARITQDLRAQEFVTIETIRSWRPRHAELIGQAQWAQSAVQAVIFTSAAKVIQRTARRKLLFVFWGEPEEPWVDPWVEKLKHYKPKPQYQDRKP